MQHASPLPRKKLPIGIQTFAKIRKNLEYYYVDKTPFALQLIDQGGYYFLSRPRRFGKSLFVDTLKELFEGNQSLFEGLYAEQHWDWSIKHPVIRLSFGGGMIKTLTALESSLERQLLALESAYSLSSPFTESVSDRLAWLIESLHHKVGQPVVVLVDEYDKPILDNLSEPEQAKTIRDGLRNIYSVLKDNDAHLKFVFITGVSKFSKVSIFSGLNNLNDITIDPEYSAICGYTEQDLDTVFAAELQGIERARLRNWYNGYNWLGEAVYNPFDVLLLFQKRRFRVYWFETGTPTFLVDFLAKHSYFAPDLSHLQTSEAILSNFDVEKMTPEALLWQTGYLTFQTRTETSSGQTIYTLGYPNREVEAALNEALLPVYGSELQPAFVARSQLDAALAKHDLKALQASLEAFFASIPHDWYRKNPLAQYEGYYASIFYSQLAALGLDTRVEDSTNKGRIDLALRYGQQVYLFEFKVIEQVPEGKALQQLIDKDYAEKYKQPGVSVTLIGVEFSREKRNIVGWDVLNIA